ncbi:hypothetical protein P421_09340 [Heyndrickxia coagulans P38]|nr:hypothetical protein P421_09340 [Heyndrickxia coagulans P38]
MAPAFFIPRNRNRAFRYPYDPWVLCCLFKFWLAEPRCFRNRHRFFQRGIGMRLRYPYDPWILCCIFKSWLAESPLFPQPAPFFQPGDQNGTQISICSVYGSGLFYSFGNSPWMPLAII